MSWIDKLSNSPTKPNLIKIIVITRLSLSDLIVLQLKFLLVFTLTTC